MKILQLDSNLSKSSTSGLLFYWNRHFNSSPKISALFPPLPSHSIVMSYSGSSHTGSWAINTGLYMWSDIPNLRMDLIEWTLSAERLFSGMKIPSFCKIECDYLILFLNKSYRKMTVHVHEEDIIGEVKSFTLAFLTFGARAPKCTTLIFKLDH